MVARNWGATPPLRKQAGAHRQRLEMVGSRRFRGDQHENEIDGESVRCLEIDRALEPREDAENLLALGELAMRNGDAVADPGRAEPLALQDRIEDLARRQA